MEGERATGAPTALRRVYPFELAYMVRDIDASTAVEERVVLSRMPEALTRSFPKDVASQLANPGGAYVGFDVPEGAGGLVEVALHLRFGSVGRPATLSLWDARRPLAVISPEWRRLGGGVERQMWLRFPVPAGAIPPFRLYLPYDTPVELLELRLASRTPAPLRPVRVPAPGRRWLAYGDSITVGRQASDPALTYPAVAARLLGMECLNLGFGGGARAEPPVAIALATMASRPDDVLSLAFGTNVYNHAWYDPPAWRAAYHNFLEIIRARRPRLPILVVSPVFFAGTGEEPERTPNSRGLSAAAIRATVEDEVAERIAAGARRLRLVRGLDVVGPGRVDLLGDHGHLNDAGYAALGAAVAHALRGLLEEWP